MGSVWKSLAALTLTGALIVACASPAVEDAVVEPPPVVQPTPIPPPAPPVAAPAPSSVHAEYARRPAPPRPAAGQLDPHGRVANQPGASADEHLEIPAFLRRQGN